MDCVFLLFVILH